MSEFSFPFIVEKVVACVYSQQLSVQRCTPESGLWDAKKAMQAMDLPRVRSKSAKNVVSGNIAVSVW